MIKVTTDAREPGIPAAKPEALNRLEQGVNGLRNSKSSGRCLVCRSLPLVLGTCACVRLRLGVSKMSSPLPFPPPGFDQLSHEERLDYIEGLLNYVVSGERYVEIPDRHREMLEERLAHYRANGFEGTPWEEFEEELDKELQTNNLR